MLAFITGLLSNQSEYNLVGRLPLPQLTTSRRPFFGGSARAQRCRSRNMKLPAATRIATGGRRAHLILHKACALILFVVTLLWLRSHQSTVSSSLHQTDDTAPHEAEKILPQKNDIVRTSKISRPALPSEYTQVPEPPRECARRYHREYLDNLSSSSVGYCSKDSPSQLHCFHSKTLPDRTDTFCYGSRTSFNTEKHKFELPCHLRTHEGPDRLDQSLPSVSSFHNYWYNTGPKHVLDQAVIIDDKQTALTTPHKRPISILVKREGNGHLWHSLMEIFALSMTIDVLLSTVNPETGEAFLTEADRENTQIVFLDDYDDGPYLDLWNLFAQKPVIRLKDMGASSGGDIIVPLAGGGNPFWQGDWEVRPCGQSELLRVFTTRVMNSCHVQTTPKSGNIRVTWIDRVEKRRLVDQERLLEAAKAKIPHVDLQSVDFAGLTFCEQVQIIRNTDVLVGVHGAGLTHGMWLQPGSTMAEVIPESLDFKGFRNLAALLGMDYFSVHAVRPSTSRVRRADWQSDDVRIEEEKFVSLVESAVRSTYKKGLHDFDIE